MENNMDYKYFDELEIIIIENVFDKEEQDLIHSELKNYYLKKILKEPEKTGSAKHLDGSLKKQNSAVFLDDLYSLEGRRISSILELTEKKFLCQQNLFFLKKIKNIFGMIELSNSHATLVNYYENSDYYDFHHDNAAFSVLTYFFKEPKSFSGGNVVFRNKKNGKEKEIEIKNNMSIFFPSFYEHKVIPIKMKKESQGEPLGRFSIAQFFYIGP